MRAKQKKKGKEERKKQESTSRDASTELSTCRSESDCDCVWQSDRRVSVISRFQRLNVAEICHDLVCHDTREPTVKEAH